MGYILVILDLLTFVRRHCPVSLGPQQKVLLPVAAVAAAAAVAADCSYPLPSC